MNNNDSFRNRQNGFETMDGGAPGKKQKKGNFGKIIGTVAAVFVLAILAMNSTYQIREQEQAVLVTLGKAQAVTDPGLHFKIPFIQQVRKVIPPSRDLPSVIPRTTTNTPRIP